MESYLINITLAFLEGFALIISPCILPVLPIILSGSLTGNRSRPYGIILGFILAFTVFTMFSRQVVLWSGIDLNIVRNISLGLLLIIGVVMISDFLSELFAALTRRLTNISTSNVNTNGILFGALLGVIWTPCAGPILAAVIVQTVLQESDITSFFSVLFFGIGAGVPMLLIALFGRSIMSKFQIFKTHGGLFRKIIGLIIILSTVYLFFGEKLILASTGTAEGSTQARLINGLTNPYPAPALAGIDGWINTQPFDIQQLKGKVVLIDFWTYSCINCIRTLPYLKSWYQKYHDQGFTIIGVHTPEFVFEKDFSNVSKAVKNFNIHYPVVLDNQFVTWRNYQNRYWPAHYLINKEGNVVYVHYGEGEYDTTENNIRFLLGMKKVESKIRTEENEAQTPEIYLGYARANNYVGPNRLMQERTENYVYPRVLPVNSWALNGGWRVSAEKITTTEANASLKIRFNARKVFAVMGAAAHSGKMRILLNGKLVVLNKGADVTDSMINVSSHRLYTLIDLSHAEEGVLELKADSPGLEIYTFTFG